MAIILSKSGKTITTGNKIYAADGTQFKRVLTKNGTVVYNYDTSAPTITITSHTASATHNISNTYTTIVFTVSDDSGVSSVTINGNAYTTKSGNTYTYYASGSSGTTTTYTIVATDANGYSSSAWVTYTFGATSTVTLTTAQQSGSASLKDCETYTHYASTKPIKTDNGTESRYGLRVYGLYNSIANGYAGYVTVTSNCVTKITGLTTKVRTITVTRDGSGTLTLYDANDGVITSWTAAEGAAGVDVTSYQNQLDGAYLIANYSNNAKLTATEYGDGNSQTKDSNSGVKGATATVELET